MVEDVVKALGYMTLGSRLKRLGERLQADTREIVGGFEDMDVSAGHNPVLVSLYRTGPCSIGTLTKAVGQSQPGVTRMVNRLKQIGLVDHQKDPGDGRVSLIALTERGTQVVSRLMETAYPLAEQAVADACADLSGPLLDQLTQLENALADRSLQRRVRIRVKTR